MEKDLTKGSPFKLIIGFAVPMLLGMLFQQFYNLVDTIIVGKTLGVNALAGVGATGALNFMIIGFCMGVCSGFVIPVAQAFGAGKGAELRKYVFNGCESFIPIVCIYNQGFCRRYFEQRQICTASHNAFIDKRIHNGFNHITVKISTAQSFGNK